MDRYEQMLRAAQEYHKKHPEVWDYFVTFTLQRINAGFKHYSARGIFHRIRWETAVPKDEGTYKISNNHSPFYAREFMKRYPEHAGFFKLNKLISKGAKPK